MPVSDRPPSSPDELTSPARRWLARNSTALAAALIALHIGLAASSALQKSPTFDEGFHITAGAANWLGADYRLHSGNGVLAQAWFALPIALAPGRFQVPNPDVVIESQPVSDFHLLTIYLARVFFYEMGNAPSDILLYARSMAIALGALLCALVFAWSRRCFGPVAGLLSCALCALSPNILAHARLATSDLIFALCLLFSVGAVWRSFWKPGVGTVIGAGLALGALALTKLSALGVIPMIALLLAVRAAANSPFEVGSAGRRFVAATTAARAAAPSRASSSCRAPRCARATGSSCSTMSSGCAVTRSKSCAPRATASSLAPTSPMGHRSVSPTCAPPTRACGCAPLEWRAREPPDRRLRAKRRGRQPADVAHRGRAGSRCCPALRQEIFPEIKMGMIVVTRSLSRAPRPRRSRSRSASGSRRRSTISKA